MPDPDFRRFGTARIVGGLLHGLALVPGWLLETPHGHAARRREQRFMQRITRQLVSDVRLSGTTPAGAGTLFVANHISWMDIPILGSRLDCSFIAKSDVRQWPVIGALSRRTGTVFVEREQRSRVDEQADSIAARLKGGDSLLLFAEGTTSDGLTILPFRSSLFEAARHASHIQPVAIGYRRGDGAMLDDARMEVIGWTGDEGLVPNLTQVSKLRLSAELRFMPSFVPVPDMTRKMLAQRCEDAVREAYAAIRAAENRSE